MQITRAKNVCAICLNVGSGYEMSVCLSSTTDRMSSAAEFPLTTHICGVFLAVDFSGGLFLIRAGPGDFDAALIGNYRQQGQATRAGKNGCAGRYINMYG